MEELSKTQLLVYNTICELDKGRNIHIEDILHNISPLTHPPKTSWYDVMYTCKALEAAGLIRVNQDVNEDYIDVYLLSPRELIKKRHDK